MYISQVDNSFPPTSGNCVPASGIFNVTHGQGNYIIEGTESKNTGKYVEQSTGQSNPTLTLLRGHSYSFNVNVLGHPFWIKTTQTTGVENAYNEGIINNGCTQCIITFDIPLDAPDKLYYNCQYHSSMKGAIYIEDDVPHNCAYYISKTTNEYYKDLSTPITSVSPLSIFSNICGKCPEYATVLSYLDNNPNKTFIDAIFDSSNNYLRIDEVRRKGLYHSVSTNETSFKNNVVGLPNKIYYNKNILIEYNKATCLLEETIVTNSPTLNYDTLVEAQGFDNILAHLMLPKENNKYFVKFIPNTAIPLSISNPKLYLSLEEEYQDVSSSLIGSECLGTCCYLVKDNKGFIYTKCMLSSKQKCTTTRLQEILDQDPFGGKVTDTDNILSVVLDSSWTGGLQDCIATDCSSKVPHSGTEGTCCYIPEGSNDWSCVVNTKENCRELDGFWEMPEQDGVGGYNPAHCFNRGTQIVQITEGINTLVTLGPRNCGVNQVFVDNKQLGSCCYFKNTKSIDNQIYFPYSVISTARSFAYTGKLRIDSSGIDKDVGTRIFTIKLFAINNGSTVVLSFPIMDLIYKIYYDNQDPNTLSQRIEKDFNIYQNNIVSNEWQLRLRSIEGGGEYLPSEGHLQPGSIVLTSRPVSPTNNS